MKLGKSIKLYLLDADPSGRIWAELSNWTGKVYKIPRSMINTCKHISELSDDGATGVYILFGSGENSKKYAYIGETENIYTRLTNHVREKDFWNEAILILSKDENLNKAHIKYLEHRMIAIANEVARYELYNSDRPKKTPISKPDQDEMEEFFLNLKLLVSTLGYKIFDHILQPSTPPDRNTNKQVKFVLSDTKGANAEGAISTEGFIVFKGAKFIKDETPSCPINIVQERAKLVKENSLLLNGNFFILQKDHLFTSPSSAASSIKGNSTSGPKEWKLKGKNNISLKEYEAEQLKK